MVPVDREHRRKQLFEQLKNLILVKYELDTPEETGSVRADLLRDRLEKKELFADPEIQEILRELLDMDPAVAGKMTSGKATEEELLSKVLEAAIQSLFVESEGLGIPDEE